MLFDRRGHRAKLTAAGRELLTEGRHILNAAGALEARVKRVATGWEAELRIAYDDIIPARAILALAQTFYLQPCGTRLRITAEVFGGCWDALASDRADLIIGAPGDGPAGGGYTSRALGAVEWLFAVAPGHPLAAAPEPLSPETLLAHRAIVVADSSRSLPPRDAGLLTGQETLTVHNVAAKLLAQQMGAGVGHLPRTLAESEAAAGRLVIKQTSEGRVSSPWCSGVTSPTSCSAAITFTAMAPGMWRGSTLRAVLDRASRMITGVLLILNASSSAAVMRAMRMARMNSCRSTHLNPTYRAAAIPNIRIASAPFSLSH